MNEAALLIGLAIMLLGFAGIFIPMMPGVPLMFVGALAYSAMTGFGILTWPWLVLFALLTAASVVVDYVATMWATRKMGASRRAMYGSGIGTLTGVLLYGAYGALAGAMAGAVLGELSLSRPWQMAARSGAGALLGFLISIISDAAFGILMLVLFLVVVL